MSDEVVKVIGSGMGNCIGFDIGSGGGNGDGTGTGNGIDNVTGTGIGIGVTVAEVGKEGKKRRTSRRE